MRKELENVVYEEVLSELGEISKMELGKDEYVKTTQGVNSMIDRLHESKKLENEALKLELEAERLKVEAEKNRNEKSNNVVKNILTGVTFAGSVIVAVWANLDSKSFEKNYTHTTEAGRASTRKLLGFLDKFK